VSLLGRRRVIQDYLAGALWVLPTLAVVVFLLAGAALSSVEVDAGSPLAKLAFQGTADDARSLLIAVSSTMITVTGLVFALTIVALQIASGQYSPRLLRNFMRDRGTQLVLSIFVGAFAYSTAGLYTVGVQGAGQEAFVPRLAVSGSLALAVASVGVLIYFIHHLARSIQIDSIMKQVEREALSVIAEVYPRQPRYREPEELCPAPSSSTTCGSAPPRSVAAEPPSRASPALIVLLRDAGIGSATEDRRHARVRHIRLVLDDARRATAQPADVEAIADEAATALRALGVDPSEVPAERRA
jgi:uncharacterized membrane protein